MKRDDARRAPEAPVVYGVHPVLELMEARPAEIDRVLVARGAGGQGLGRVLRAAREAGVPVSHIPRDVLARRAGRGASHQGVAAVVAAAAYVPAAEIVGASRSGGRGLVVVLDGVEDPRNLGAILRSAAAAGADGAILSSEGTVGLTPAAVKASAGVAARLPVARERRLPAFLGSLESAGFTVVGLDPRAETVWHEADLGGPLALVAGGEGRGLRPGVLRRCSARVGIPLARGVESLNVSVAVAIVLFEAVRQAAVGKNLRGGS